MRKLLTASTLLLAGMIGIATPAWASQPGLATGSGVVFSHTQTLIRVADGNATFSVVDLSVDSGGLSGTVTDTYTATIHPDGTATGKGIETCSSCTIGGRTGSYVATFTIMGNADFSQYGGHLTFLQSGGGLAGLQGEGTFSGSGPFFTYSLNYHFQ